MKHYIRISLTICLSISLSVLVTAQKRATDRDIEGFKGPVKSVQSDYTIIVDTLGKRPPTERVHWAIYLFNADGSLDRIQYPSDNDQLVFKLIDGFKTFASGKIDNTPDGPAKGMFVFIDETPVEGPDKLTAPDPRFSQKYVYEYDEQGRVKTERMYLNNGKLETLSTFKYDNASRIVDKTVKDPIAFTKYHFRYDDQSNLLETSKDRHILGPGIDSTTVTVYSSIVADKFGNWLQRKKIETSSDQGDPRHRIPPSKFTTETMEYQTIVYY